MDQHSPRPCYPAARPSTRVIQSSLHPLTTISGARFFGACVTTGLMSDRSKCRAARHHHQHLLPQRRLRRHQRLQLRQRIRLLSLPHSHRLQQLHLLCHRDLHRRRDRAQLCRRGRNRRYDADNVTETDERKKRFKRTAKPSVQSASSAIPQKREKSRHFLAIPSKLGVWEAAL